MKFEEGMIVIDRNGNYFKVANVHDDNIKLKMLHCNFPLVNIFGFTLDDYGDTVIASKTTGDILIASLAPAIYCDPAKLKRGDIVIDQYGSVYEVLRNEPGDERVELLKHIDANGGSGEDGFRDWVVYTHDDRDELSGGRLYNAKDPKFFAEGDEVKDRAGNHYRVTDYGLDFDPDMPIKLVILHDPKEPVVVDSWISFDCKGEDWFVWANKYVAPGHDIEIIEACDLEIANRALVAVGVRESHDATFDHKVGDAEQTANIAKAKTIEIAEDVIKWHASEGYFEVEIENLHRVKDYFVERGYKVDGNVISW